VTVTTCDGCGRKDRRDDGHWLSFAWPLRDPCRHVRLCETCARKAVESILSIRSAAEFAQWWANRKKRKPRRLSTQVAPAVLRFFRTKRERGQRHFYMQELQSYVTTQFPFAPDSPSRIMRGLRQRKRLNYKLISRKKSLYEIVARRAA
jgi:hypothetical protein